MFHHSPTCRHVCNAQATPRPSPRRLYHLPTFSYRTLRAPKLSGKHALTGNFCVRGEHHPEQSQRLSTFTAKIRLKQATKTRGHPSIYIGPSPKRAGKERLCKSF